MDRLAELPEPSQRAAPESAAALTVPRGDHDLNPDLYDPAGPLRDAAVLVPIIDYGDRLSVLLTRRSEELPDHPGQISFPGGRVDPGDSDAEDAALREAEEEVGLTRDRVRLIGRLDTYVIRTGYCVIPVIGLVAPPLSLQPEAGEVDEIFEVPLTFFLDAANRQTHSRVFHGKTRFFYAYPYGDYFIWGATAGMISNLAEVLRDRDLVTS
ncbi:CoA pyrophosphatase [Pelagibius litoralis]|uniref:CoA pyrophosphatase n=1 Tax=Pelagibius litoralis TaxID=374515 RepID=A0A967F2C9_9PROT|nr:CoA pyrophosphatase [Pelagibius litoralis]